MVRAVPRSWRGSSLPPCAASSCDTACVSAGLVALSRGGPARLLGLFLCGGSPPLGEPSAGEAPVGGRDRLRAAELRALVPSGRAVARRRVRAARRSVRLIRGQARDAGGAEPPGARPHAAIRGGHAQ